MADRTTSGEYRDAHLEMEPLLRKSGPISESAVQTDIQIHAPFFTQVGPDLRHRLTGETLEDWVKGRRKTAPHNYLDFIPDTEAQVEFEMIEDACLRTSPKTVGALFKKLGETRAREIMKQWNADPVRMIAGTRPNYADETEKAKKPKGDGTNNPYNPAKTYGSDAVRQNEIGKYIRAYGARAAAKSAHDYSVDLAGRPIVRPE